jgi:hypothetical protein
MTSRENNDVIFTAYLKWNAYNTYVYNYRVSEQNEFPHANLSLQLIVPVIASRSGVYYHKEIKWFSIYINYLQIYPKKYGIEERVACQQSKELMQHSVKNYMLMLAKSIVTFT